MRWYPLKSGGCLGQTRNSPKTVSPLSFLAQIEALNTITLKTSNFARPEWCKPAWFCQLALRFVARRANLADLVKLGFDSLEIVQLRISSTSILASMCHLRSDWERAGMGYRILRLMGCPGLPAYTLELAQASGHQKDPSATSQAQAKRENWEIKY